jgi:hypothetical protein
LHPRRSGVNLRSWRVGVGLPHIAFGLIWPVTSWETRLEPLVILEMQWKDVVPYAGPVVSAFIAAVVSTFFGFWNPFTQRRLERLRADLQKGLEERKGELQQELEGRKLELQIELETRKGVIQGELEAVKADFADVNKERDARRDYEYDAKKRLYAEIEPLLFQLFQASENAYRGVLSLARSRRAGKLRVCGKGWLSGEGYYLKSTAYRLLLPALLFGLIQRKLTLVDLALDETIRTKFYLLQMYYRTFSADFDLAGIQPQLLYEPDGASKEQAQSEPARYSIQGIYAAHFDKVVEAALIRSDGVADRPSTFGEFEERLLKTEQRNPLRDFAGLYLQFDPEPRPVLARMLLTQALISKMIREIRRLDRNTSNAVVQLARSCDSAELAWVDGQGQPGIRIGEAYVLEQLRRISVEMST